MKALQIKNFKKSFGGVAATKNLSLDFEFKKITSVIGPNGAGKSTLVNLLTGYIPLDEGGMILSGNNLKNWQPYEIPFFGMTRTFQNVGLFEQMPVLENLLIAMTERHFIKSLFEQNKEEHFEIGKKLLKKVGLWEKRNDLAENLSYGQRKLLEIVRAIAVYESKVSNASKFVFLFDEPFAGLFPEMVKKVMALLKELKEQGHAVILIEHNMDLIRELSDHVFVLNAGELLAEGAPEKVLNDKEVINAYLGD